MAEIPTQGLSRHFQELLQGRSLISAIFLTFQFDPGFFQLEILPIFFDFAFSNEPTIKCIQIDDCLRSLSGEIAVYYDHQGLVPSGECAASMDVKRFAVRHRTGIFHPKNVFLLTKRFDEESGEWHQTLFVSSLSANLTKSGWWVNVEVCHTEALEAGSKSRMKNDLIDLLKSVRQKVPGGGSHDGLEQIVTFLKQKIDQRPTRSEKGCLFPHFYNGSQSLDDFLDEAAGNLLKGTHLEIISPYFDKGESAPLAALLKRFQPESVRVFLPMNSQGEADCSKKLLEFVENLPETEWGFLPKSILKRGSSVDAGDRFVHAKVYRFFQSSPRREILFVGSVNLTSSAHQRGGNLETGTLIMNVPARTPVSWLTPIEGEVTCGSASTNDEDELRQSIPLLLNFNWETGEALAFWDSPDAPGVILIERTGSKLFEISSLNPRQWVALPASSAEALQFVLQTSYLVTVREDGGEAVQILVQEEGFSFKPSLVLRLSLAQILKYWSLLSQQQRLEFIEERAVELGLAGYDTPTTVGRKPQTGETMFSRFTGFFHAFGCLEREVLSALEANQEKRADFRLFGRKHDSLGPLLELLANPDEEKDSLDRYLLWLCAKQLIQEVRKTQPEYWERRRVQVGELLKLLAKLETARQELCRENPREMEDFLAWLEPRFLKKARPLKEGE